MPVPEALRSFGAFGAFGESPGAGAFAVPGSRPALNLTGAPPPDRAPPPPPGAGLSGAPLRSGLRRTAGDAFGPLPSLFGLPARPFTRTPIPLKAPPAVARGEPLI